MSPLSTRSSDNPYPAWAQDSHATQAPKSESAPAPPAAPTAPYNGPAPEDTGHPWHIWKGPAPLVVNGGSVSVNTADLDTLSADLNSAAGSLDDARSWIDCAISDVNSAPLPPGTKIYGSYDLQPHGNEVWHDDGMQCVAGERLPRSMYSDQLYETDETGAVHFNALSYSEAVALDQERNTAISSLNALNTGAGSLQDVADTLRGIASDVSACSQAHTLADGGATPGSDLVGPVDIRAFDGGLVHQALGVTFATMFPDAVGLSVLLLAPNSPVYQLLKDNEGGQAVFEAFQLLAADPATAQWVKDDAARLVLLTLWLQKARTGRESATIEAYLKQVSERLDPWVMQRLPAQVTVGTQTVDTKSLTPMQRVTKYLGLNAAMLGSTVYGRQTGITVTPMGGSGATVLPPATKDPLGLGSPVQAGMTGKGKESKPPRNISETILHCQELQASRGSLGEGYEEAGVISIQRVEHADGRVSWVVYVPGTTDWTVGDGEPQDLLTNLEAVGGTPTAMESGVVTAMRQAGIQPGEEVALYGHSQGGITVSNIAADPAIQGRYNITTVLTAGSPTAGADIPDDVHALHLENTGDAVPGLDAAPTPTGPHRQVAMLDTHQTSTNGYPHASSAYAQAAEGLEDKAPELADWNKSFSRASGAGEQGTSTTEYTFAVQRNTDPNGIYKGGATYRGKVPSAQPSYPRPTPSPQTTGEH